MKKISDNLKVNNHEINRDIGSFKIKFIFKYQPFSKEINFDSLPIISHLEMYKNDIITNINEYRSYFFEPELLMGFDSIDQFVDSVIKHYIDNGIIDTKNVKQFSLF